ncbi:MAG: class I SAM-dependent methyltransferase [Hyphomicrobiales bacterium]|nr:class I SAM-dependent methyltransferase [Hyphomicrobiales bacterium]MDE2115641.1 class I SAM-dependent methyltransferase [Hyphomicrobiales bacterium]
MSEPAARLMDRMYRYQRYIYDFTRKPYLLGRDRMLAGLNPPVGGTILEIGCGTGRNLIRAAQIYPQTRLYGFDVAAVMLETASQNIARRGLAGRIRLAKADAVQFDPLSLFGVRQFDRIYISYALSMIPDWQNVLKQALPCLAPGGSLHVVDFGEQGQLPGWFASPLRKWLAMFDVYPRAELVPFARDLAQAHACSFLVQNPLRGYAVLAQLKRM